MNQYKHQNNNKEGTMAIAIKETPILCGEDAKIFEEKINRNKEEKASREEYTRVMNNYYKMKEKE